MVDSTLLSKAILEIFVKSKEIQKRKKRHDFVQYSLKDYFVERNFKVRLEYETKYLHMWKIKRDRGKIELRTGLIDVYAKNDDLEIAIEYDNQHLLKWKSIEKLL